jgi:hypothetical protein
METADSRHDCAEALRCLLELALRRGGYLRRGVWGWALPADVQRIIRNPVAEMFPDLHRRGLVNRDDVRAPKLRRPVWTYRITPEGMLSLIDGNLDEELCRVAHTGAEPDGAVYVPPRARVALDELRAAAEREARSRHTPGERGWTTGPDLLESARERGSGAAGHMFDSGDLEWLIRTGLAERRHVRYRWRTRPVVLYHASALGGTIAMLEWHAPGNTPAGSGG